MLYRQIFDTFIRHYYDCGYITNRNGLGDRVVDASGAVFLSALWQFLAGKNIRSPDSRNSKKNKEFLADFS